MSNSWAKVRSFLDMMDIQDLDSSLPSYLSSISYSSSSNGSLQLLSIDARKWYVGEKTAQQILYVIQPNEDSENRRQQIIEYLQTLMENAFGIKVFPFGSVPLKTYLPDGDIDLTAVNHSLSSQDLASEICSLLEDEEKNNTTFQVKDVLCVPAQVRVVKCTVDGICVDISFNQTAGLCAFYFLEQVDRFIGKDHLFKRSVILIKAWCYYESRIQGGLHGLISTYALETMVLHVINLFHSSLQCPLAVLYKFLEYYSTFDWKSYCVGINGLVLISSLPNIVVVPPSECDDLLLTDAFLKSSRETVLSSMGIFGRNISSFPVKFLNILDPLRDDNNLGRSVSKGNFYRIRSALSYGAEKLGDILMLPLENIKNGLEIFFKDTLERNGKGKREDVIVPVSSYGSEISNDKSGRDPLLGIHYDRLFLDYSIMYPAAPRTSKNHKFWNHQWIETGHNVQFDQNMYYDFNKSARSFDFITSFATRNAVSGNENSKSRGTGTFIPRIKHLRGRNMVRDQNEKEHGSCRELKSVKEHEIRKEYEVIKEVNIDDYPACSPREVNPPPEEDENIDALNFSIEEFPVLPGSKPKPIPMEVSLLLDSPEPTHKEPSASLVDSLEFDSFKHSSPRSMLSEAGNPSDSDISVILDLVGDPISVTVSEDQESLKSEEKLVVPEQSLQLADDLEFPPLSRPPEPVITLTKKEFPPLRSCLKSHKSHKWKDFKEVKKRIESYSTSLKESVNDSY